MSQVPLVVAVLVAHDPGGWFEEALVSIAHSNYPNLEVAIVDNASTSSIESRIGRILPLARVIRLETDLGYSRACNEGAQVIEGGSHFVFCHDDVALAPDAITEMMEVAFAENAGIVTPKVMVWDSPRQILQLGLDLDKTGAVASRVDVGDLDQSQYDQVEEVFVAPGGCTLIRADLFKALGGFDEYMDLYYEDVDLSWRAHLLGARVVTAPSAKVRHLMVSTDLPVIPRRRRGGYEATGRTGVGHLRRLQASRRNQLRILLKDSDRRQRRGLISRFLLLSFIEMIFYMVTGRPRLSGAIYGAIKSNFANRKSIASLRKDLIAQSFTGGKYQVKFISGSAKISAYLASRRGMTKLNRSRAKSGQIPLGFRYVAEGHVSSEVEHRAESKLLGRIATLVIWITGVGFFVATRSLISGHLPLLGSMAPFPSPGYLLSHYFTATYSTPLLGHQPAPTLWLLFGILELIFVGSSSIMMHFVILASPAIGAIGVYRLVATRRGREAGKISAALYLAMPIFHQAMLLSSFESVLSFAVVPWTIHLLIRARMMANGSRRQSRRAHIAAGLVLGLAGAVSPALWIVIIISAVAVAIPLSLSGQSEVAKGGLKTVGIASIFSVLVNLPWALALAWPGHPVAALFGVRPPVNLDFYNLLRMGDSVSSGSLLPVVLWIVAIVTPFISRSVRARESAVLLFEASFLLVLGAASSGGLLGITPVSIDLLNIVLAVVLVDIAGIAVRAVAKDLSGFSLGWRQPVIMFLSLALLISMAVELPAIVSGRLGLPNQGYESALSFMSPAPQHAGVLWMGSPADLPVGAWRVANGLSISVTPAGSVDQTEVQLPPRLEAVQSVVTDLKAAVSGQVVNLGSQLAALGIGYVVIPQQIGAGEYFLGSDLDLIMERQLDLKQLLVDPSLIAFQVVQPVNSKPTVSPAPIASLLTFLGIVGQLLAVLLVILALVRKRSFLLDADGEALLRNIRRELALPIKGRESKDESKEPEDVASEPIGVSEGLLPPDSPVFADELGSRIGRQSEAKNQESRK